MKILLISFHFPPENAIGAVRVGKLAKYLVENGHEVRVLTREFLQPATTLPVEIDDLYIIRTKWFDINSIPSLFFGGKKRVKQAGYKTTSNFV